MKVASDGGPASPSHAEAVCADKTLRSGGGVGLVAAVLGGAVPPAVPKLEADDELLRPPREADGADVAAAEAEAPRPPRPPPRRTAAPAKAEADAPGGAAAEDGPPLPKRVTRPREGAGGESTACWAALGGPGAELAHANASAAADAPPPPPPPPTPLLPAAVAVAAELPRAAATRAAACCRSDACMP